MDQDFLHPVQTLMVFQYLNQFPIHFESIENFCIIIDKHP